MKADDVLRWLLAWGLMCSGMRPPLYPTTTALLFFLAVNGETKIGQLYEVMDCSDVTVRTQLHRMKMAGIVRSQWDGKRNRYALTESGMRMVYQWVGKTIKIAEKL